jgi:hypothetical protein
MTRLDDVSGVERSYVNQRGYEIESNLRNGTTTNYGTNYGNDYTTYSEASTYLLLEVRPGVDQSRVIQEARRIVTQEFSDRKVQQLERSKAATPLAREEWQDRSEVAHALKTPSPTPAQGFPWLWLIVLLLVSAPIGLSLVFWLRYRQSSPDEPAKQPSAIVVLILLPVIAIQCLLELITLPVAYLSSKR